MTVTTPPPGRSDGDRAGEHDAQAGPERALGAALNVAPYSDRRTVAASHDQPVAALQRQLARHQLGPHDDHRQAHAAGRRGSAGRVRPQRHQIRGQPPESPAGPPARPAAAGRHPSPPGHRRGGAQLAGQRASRRASEPPPAAASRPAAGLLSCADAAERCRRHAVAFWIESRRSGRAARRHAP